MLMKLTIGVELLRLKLSTQKLSFMLTENDLSGRPSCPSPNFSYVDLKN